MPQFKDDSCYTSAGKFCACVEFHLDEDHRHGFHTSQLIDYTLEPNPDAGDDNGGRAQAPPQKLALAFSTADVVILGWRLGLLADKLRENDLATVHVLPKRYADLDRHKPFVASISITPIDAGKDRNNPK
jgi:hypothetical protein